MRTELRCKSIWDDHGDRHVSSLPLSLPSVHSEQEGELSFGSSIRIILDSWTFLKLLIARDRLGAPLMQLNVAVSLGPKTRPLFLSGEQLNSS